MNQKNNTGLLSLIAFLLLVSQACKKDFLERAPSDFISKDEVFSNIENAEAFVNGIYTLLPGIAVIAGDGYYNLESSTDGAATMWQWQRTSLNFNTGNWNPQSYPMSERWKDYYNGVRRANIVIENHDKVPSDVGGHGAVDRKQRLLGEAYGLRAFFYFQLFKMYGELPLIPSFIDPGGEQTAYPRSSVTDVVEFITEDLEKAISLLPAKHDQSELGRYTATVAHGLLSRTLLYYASPLFNPDNIAARWEAAATAAKNALDFALESGFELSKGSVNGKKEYERIFLEILNPEVIWSDGKTGSLFDGHDVDYWFGSLGYGGWYGEGPLQEFVDSYEMINGEFPVLGYTSDNKQIVNDESGYDPANPYANRDPRFYQTVLYQDAEWQGRTVNFRPGGVDYATDRPRVNYMWRKFTLAERNLFTGAGHYARRFVMMRLGEFYLNYAEALNEMGRVDEAIQNVNVIRERVGMIELPSSLTQHQLRDRIRNERKIELVLENHRFWDVRRWKIAENVDNGVVRKVDVDADGNFSYPVFQNRVFDKRKHYLFPIPQLEMDKNKEQWNQNPGW